jgi:probable rRNA maturation factor
MFIRPFFAGKYRRGFKREVFGKIRKLQTNSYLKEEPIAVDILFDAGRAHIVHLNNLYRNKDKPTDILSFNLDRDRAQIVVSLQDVKVLRDRTYNESLVEIVKHGILHILGFDHRTLTEAKQMAKASKRIFG